tara:strand:- start:51 stop:410 length:360 start_codon:yes stop_codon:yes gene_type:complete
MQYVVHNILFKFAVDFTGLYHGDHPAAKVAALELKGSIAYFNALTEEQRKKVRIPMLVLVDYLGYRLIAESFLPIDRSTIIYGTEDAGWTIHAKDSEFNRYAFGDAVVIVIVLVAGVLC